MEHCDWRGTCGNKAYAEVYPLGTGTWNYLCRRHYSGERGKKRRLFCVLRREQAY